MYPGGPSPIGRIWTIWAPRSHLNFPAKIAFAGRTFTGGHLPADICRPDKLAAIALSFAAFDKREPERAEMGAERPISASTEKKKKKDLRSQSFRVCFLESQKLPQHLALLDQETESSSQLDTLQNSNWPVQLNRIQKRQKDCYKTL